jgi:hypothetical protein
MTDAFGEEQAVVPDARTPFYDAISEGWPGQRTIREYEERRHQRELERAARQPVINVTVTGVPGHLSADTGSGRVEYSPEPVPRPEGPLSVLEPPCT